MTYPCEIIKDLLPLYIDDVCNEESKQAVKQHLSQCEACRHTYNTMKETDGFAKEESSTPEDITMASSLKKVKNRMKGKIRTITISVSAVALIAFLLLNLMFHTPVKDVKPDDVFVSADVYELENLKSNHTEHSQFSETVTIFADGNDSSQPIQIQIPQIGNVALTENTIEKCKFATVVSISSDYLLRTIESETVDHTIYVKSFKTTLFNNKAKDYQHQMSHLEFHDIHKVVFVDDNGSETILWSHH